MKGKTWKKAMLLVVCLLVAQLVIGASIVAAAPPAWGPTYHCVRYGETLSSIGRLYGVNAYAIARANGLANPNYITPARCSSFQPAATPVTILATALTLATPPATHTTIAGNIAISTPNSIGRTQDTVRENQIQSPRPKI
jgi:hypothetical protein